jgi:hypothetical protein
MASSQAVVYSPDGNCIAGHGYGGSILFWTRVVHRLGGATAMTTTKTMTIVGEGVGNGEADGYLEDNHNNDNNDNVSLLAVQWVVNPCIMGHF